MLMIGDIKIAYKDTELVRMLTSLRTYRPEVRTPLEAMSGYLLPMVTKDALKVRNVLFNPLTNKCELTDRNDLPSSFVPDPRGKEEEAGEDILFCGTPQQIITRANACFSFIFFAKQPMLAAAVHVPSRYYDEPGLHRKMVAIAIANLRKMAPRSPITGYVSGGYGFGEIQFSDRTRMFFRHHNQMLVFLTVYDILSQGVFIRSIDVGDNYLKQTLDLATRKYTIERAPIDADGAVTPDSLDPLQGGFGNV